MRIRKHAKISPLLYATSSLQPRTVIQTHVCQLNQSPWDVMIFSPPSAPPPPPSPPPLKVNKYDYSETNSCSRDSISIVESEELGDEYSWRKLEYSDGGSATNDKAEEEEEEGHVIYCCKTDGKMWRCKRKASPGHAMCEHHLTMMRNYTNNSGAPKKQAPAVEVAKCRPRPKKASASSSSSNPYEFYYYSGFGPRWGKKRGQVNTNNGCDDMPKDLEHEHEKEPPKTSQFVDDDFEYSEDEDKGNEHGKKRPRKPIKARSLKSLM